MASAEKRYKVRNGRTTKQFTWRARYLKPDGTQGSEPGFPTKAKAEEWGEEQERKIREGTWIDPDLYRSPFGVFARRYMAERPKRGRTMDTRWDNLDRYILPKWEHAPLISVTWFDVDSWQMTLPCDDVTKGHCVSLMSTILTGAVDARWLPINPIAGRQRTKAVVHTPAVMAAAGDEEKTYTPEAVLQVAERLGPAKGLHVITTAWTGVNWGEGLGLQRANALAKRRQPWGKNSFWECFVLRIVQEVAEYEDRDEHGKKLGTVLRLEPTKNEFRTRDLDLPPFLARLWHYHLADWPYDHPLSTPNGKWWRRSNWLKQLRPAADGREERKKRQGVSYREAWKPIATGMTMRGLRHTHDSWQDQIGVRAALAYEQAGHKRPGIKRVYQHPTPTMRQERLDGMEEIFSEAMANLGWTSLWGRVSLVKPPVEVDLPNLPQTISIDDWRQSKRGYRSRSEAM
ncbi:hypothetical protein [Streptomyces phaeochromogenes]|uniref:hypothetical protein n=1 Tax=Streptomyces phaeochromogenes TaxID=1923 RepID=UPI002DDBD144|nr:hypothetical protein [Streptomyces phaeochromogenes]WRZ30238.1 hypothetical protein OG931_22035 [Streptomyces phaeochromogenes]